MAKAPAKKDTKKTAAKKTAAAKKEAKPAKEKAVKAKPEKKASKPVAEEVEVVETSEASEIPAEKPEKAAKAPKEKKPPKLTKAAIAAAKFSSDENKKWNDLREKHAGEKAANYAMSASYEPNQPLQHKVLGWGFIVSVQNDRLEVLFETGTKMLISNYKG